MGSFSVRFVGLVLLRLNNPTYLEVKVVIVISYNFRKFDSASNASKKSFTPFKIIKALITKKQTMYSAIQHFMSGLEITNL